MRERIVKARLRIAPACMAAAFTLGAVGCFSWRPYEPLAPLSQTTGLPYRLRATLADGSQAELTSPFVRADTLYGRSGPQRDTLAIAVPAVRGLERERLSIWRTLVVTVVAPAAALFTVVAIACAGDGCEPQPTR
jgi:hypothetical protein